MSEIYAIPYLEKIVIAFNIVIAYVNRSLFKRFVFMDGQADYPIFYKVEIYLDRLLVPETYIIPTFVKID